MDLSTHLIICTGRNDKLKKDLEKIKLHASNSITILGFTEKISDLMAISDLIVTKPGPGTINEAIAMRLPILIDNVDTSLFWERANMDMVIKYGVGERIKDYGQMRHVLRNYLYDEPTRKELQRCLAEFPANQFHMRIKEIIDSMVGLQSEEAATPVLPLLRPQF